jgi:surface antigen
MHMRKTLLCGVLAAALGLGATGTARAQDNTLTGALLGGAAGAGVGYAFGKGKGAAIGGVTGLALGALAGNSIDRSRERTYAAPPPTYYAPPPPPAGYYYAPAPAPAYSYYPAQPAYAPPPAPAPTASYSTANCREYSGTIIIDGREQPSYGTACLQPDGTWRIVR